MSVILRHAVQALTMLLLATACSTASDSAATPSTVAATEPVIGAATFEQWVQQASDVFLGTIQEVDEEIATTVHTGFTARRLKLTVEQPIRGTATAGQTIPAFIFVDRQVQVSAEWVSARLVIVGRFVDSQTTFPVQNGPPLVGLELNPAATYRLVSQSGSSIGIPIRGQVSAYGFTANFVGIQKALVAGKRVHAIDAVPVAELIRRAKRLDVPLELQLGYAELYRDRPSPTYSSRGAEPQDATP